MRLRALLETDALGLRLLGGAGALDRRVSAVMTTDLRDPSRYLAGGELVLTGLAWRRSGEDSEPFVRILSDAGVAGLAAGEAELRGIPDDLVSACARHRLPLFAVDEDVAFATITEHVARQVSGERAGDLAAVVDRHRRLMTSGPSGGGLEAVLDLLTSDLDLRAWVLSPTGRLVAGAGEPLPAGRAALLAAGHLGAVRSGQGGPHRVAVAGTAYSLFAVGAQGRGNASAAFRDARESVLSDWLLAVEADADDWPPARLDLLQGVTRLIAVERDRRDAARTVRRRLAQEVADLIGSDAAPAEVAARLRVAAPVLLPGTETAPYWQLVVARVEWAHDGTGAAADGGRAAQAVLEEILVDVAGAGGPAGVESSDRVAVARAGDEAIALVPHAPTLRQPAPEQEPVPVPVRGAGLAAAEPAAARAPGPGAGGDVEAGPGLRADALLDAVRAPLSAGLGEDGRVTLGVSAAVPSADGLRGALEEARHARRVAAARPGPVCAAGHDELASHVLLLPFVPDDVRRAFTARLLDPLREYDRRHRAELITTLGTFLDCDGSWTRCSARLHLHVNTLRYRVGRIEQLTGRDLSRLEDRTDFFLALRMS